MSIYNPQDQTQHYTTLEEITNNIVSYSNAVINSSPFLLGLRSGNITKKQLSYIFIQYAHWRNQFHTWFGLCIAKSGSSLNRYIVNSVTELAKHMIEEMEDDHTGMYLQFLEKFGITEECVQTTEKSNATIKYSESFLDTFGVKEKNFVESLSALSARELYASIRNTHMIKSLEENYDISAGRWLSVHKALELEHYKNTIYSILPVVSDTRDLVSIMKAEIDRHVSYWDDLLLECCTTL